jgi:hypothetical protein
MYEIYWELWKSQNSLHGLIIKNELFDQYALIIRRDQATLYKNLDEWLVPGPCSVLVYKDVFFLETKRRLELQQLLRTMQSILHRGRLGQTLRLRTYMIRLGIRHTEHLMYHRPPLGVSWIVSWSCHKRPNAATIMDDPSP